MSRGHGPRGVKRAGLGVQGVAGAAGVRGIQCVSGAGAQTQGITMLGVQGYDNVRGPGCHICQKRDRRISKKRKNAVKRKTGEESE